MTNQEIIDSLYKFNNNISYIFDVDSELVFMYKQNDIIQINKLKQIIETFKTSDESVFTIDKYSIKISRVVIEKITFFTVIIFEYNNKPYFIKQSMEYILSVIDQIPAGIALIEKGEIIHRNKAIASILGLSESTVLMQPEEFLSKDFSDIIYKLISGELKGKQEIFVQLNDQDPKWIIVESGFFTLIDTEYSILFVHDITIQKQHELEFKQQKEQLGYAFESINDGVIIIDNNDIITLFNKGSEKLTGFTKDEAIGKVINEVIVTINEDNFLFDYMGLNEVNNNSLILKAKNNLFRQVFFKKTQVVDNTGNTYGSVITITDISSSKRKEKEILYLSYHDVLTGLHNRTFFEEQLRLLDTVRQFPLAVIMGDVNGLKLTNDVFGHDAGDRLLRNFAKVIKNTCRHEDVIARWGGDEFIILLPMTNEQQVHIIMKRIESNIERLYKTKELTSIIPSLSLGFGVKNNELENIYDALKTAESNMYKKKMLTSSSVYGSIINSMKSALYEKSNETEAHADRLFTTCKSIAEKYEISSDKMSELELFAMLHDIGKIGISDKILNKTGKLTKDEWKEMKTHPEIGYRISQSSKELKGVGEYILSHHEHFDGSGYPRGLKGFEIPLLARILSVADAFDAMTNNRTYQKARSKKLAFKELLDHSGTQFDPEIVKIFIEENK